MTELQQKYLEISKDITLVLEDMKSNWDRYPDYLGWFDKSRTRKISTMELGQLGQ